MRTSARSLTAAAIFATALSMSNEARADGGDLAAGLFGGLVAGAIVGSALTPRPPDVVYVAPGPYYAPPPPPVCFGRAQVFDPYYGVYRWQRVQVPCY